MTTALEGGEGSASRPGRSLLGERPGICCTGGCVRPRAGLDMCGKSRPPPEFDPRTVRPVSSRYTDWATRPTTHQGHYFNMQPSQTGVCTGRTVLYWVKTESLIMFQVQAMKENTRPHFSYHNHHENWKYFIVPVRSKSFIWSSFEVMRLIYCSGFVTFW
jgi:hypothetical protein